MKNPKLNPQATFAIPTLELKGILTGRLKEVPPF